MKLSTPGSLTDTSEDIPFHPVRGVQKSTDGFTGGSTLRIRVSSNPPAVLELSAEENSDILHIQSFP